MQVTFYKLSKVYNSTKRPESDGRVVNCEIDEPCSILTPKLKLNFGQTNPPTDYNYCEIPDFKRSYYTSNWTYAHGLWYCDLTVDVMCTYRDNIGKSSQYIVRASNDNEDSLMDSAYPTEAGAYMHHEQAEWHKRNSPGTPFYFTANYDKGTYVLGIINRDEASKTGAVSYYGFKPGDFKIFMRNMLQGVDWLGIDEAEISWNLVKILYNPLEYIVSCMWYPFEIEGGIDYTNLNFGFWSLPATCTSIGATGREIIDGQVKIPKHPQAESEFSYFNLSPFTRYTLFIPGFGECPMDTTELMNYKTLFMEMDVDLVSGIAVVYLSTEGDAALTTRFKTMRTQIAVPIQLASITRDYMGVAGNVLTGAGQLLEGKLGGALSSISSSIQAALPQVQSTGANGTSVEYGSGTQLLAEWLYQTTINNNYNGRPLCRYKTVRNLKGYMQCENAKVEIAGYRSEMTEIENIMNTGFYYE